MAKCTRGDLQSTVVARVRLNEGYSVAIEVRMRLESGNGRGASRDSPCKEDVEVEFNTTRKAVSGDGLVSAASRRLSVGVKNDRSRALEHARTSHANRNLVLVSEGLPDLLVPHRADAPCTEISQLSKMLAVHDGFLLPRSTSVAYNFPRARPGKSPRPTRRQSGRKHAFLQLL